MITISDFDNVNPRFLLPIDELDIRFYYGELYIASSDRPLLQNILSKALRNATAGFSEITPRDITAALPDRSEDSESSLDSVYAFGGLTIPVYDFAVQIGRTQIRIAKQHCSFADALAAVNVISELIRQLVPPTVTDGSLIDAIGKRGDLYSTTFSMAHRLRLREDLNNRSREVTNVETAEKLIKLKIPQGLDSHSSPFGALQMEDVMRADVSIFGNRLFSSGPRQITLNIKCPFNISRKDVDVEVSCRSGYSQVPFELNHLYDLQTPFLDFYRDLILGQFFEDMFGSLSLEAR